MLKMRNPNDVAWMVGFNTFGTGGGAPVSLKKNRSKQINYLCEKKVHRENALHLTG
jgi:hypothetical protein